MSDDAERSRDRTSRSDHEHRSRRATSSGTGSRPSDSTRSARMSLRTEQEQEAKRRARNPGSTSRSSGDRSRPSVARLEEISENGSGQARRSARRTEEELEAKRRARDGVGSSVPPSNSSNGVPANNNTRQLAPPTPMAAPNNPPSGAVELQAELVDEEEEIERVRQQLEEENDRLRAQMDAENEEYRRQLATNNVEAEVLVVEASDVTNDDSDEGKFFSKQCTIMCLVLVFLVGAGVGAYFGLKPVFDPVKDTPTSKPTAPPTFSPPSQSPTLGLVYPKPTPKECLAVISGGQVEGQETMGTRGFEVQLQVSLQKETNVNDILSALRVTTQALLIPELVGCIGNATARKLLVSLRRVAAERNLRRYAIANGKFVSNYISDQTCVPAGDGPCHLVITTLSLALKDEQETDVVLLGLLSDIYGVDDLKSKLLLVSPFDSITLGGIKTVQLSSNSDPTDAPAASPTTNGNDDILTSSPGSSPTTPPT